jgi:peptidoglycan/LPS O-acetylase OafA/YrhL
VKLQWLSDFDGRRDNNFTVIRLVFSLLVLFGHSYSVTRSGLDPISSHLGIWIGRLAVDGFFVISGFLVTASLLKNGPVQYAVARILRIYPAIIVCTLLSAFGLGLALTTLPKGDYLHHPVTWDFLKTIPLIDVHYYLPGVFQHNPFSKGVNGSLWTLPAEVRCYVLLLCIGFVGALERTYRANIVILAFLTVGFISFPSVPLLGHQHQFAEPAAYFALGALTWVNRRLIPLGWPFAAAALIVAISALHLPPLFVLFAPSVVYLIFYCAYALPHVDLDRFGDISYGVYIYAWPMQQTVFWPGQSGATNAMFATVFVIPLAYLSWIAVEKPSLGAKAWAGRMFSKIRKSRPAVRAADAQAG